MRKSAPHSLTCTAVRPAFWAMLACLPGLTPAARGADALLELPGARLLWGADPAQALDTVAPAGYWGVRSDNDFRGSRQVNVAGQPFARAWRVAIGQKPGKPWGAQFRGKLPVALEKDRAYVLRFSARAAAFGDETPRATGQVSQPALGTFAVGPEWQRFDRPFQAERDHAAGEFEVVMFLGFDRQILEVGGLGLVAFAPEVDLDRVTAVTTETSPPPSGAARRTTPREPDIAGVTGAQVDEARVTTTLHVDQRHVAADDGNPGTPEQPLRTVAAGLERAKKRLAEGESIKVRIHPGVYREGELVLSGATLGDKARAAVLVIEGGEGVHIRGSEDWSQADWRPVRDEAGQVHHYRAAWPHAFGLRGPGWGNFDPKRGPAAYRREMVFVDGRPLTSMFVEQYTFEQAYKPRVGDPYRELHGNTHLRYTGFRDPKELLVHGTFAVAERDDAHRGLYLRLPEGKKLGEVSIEVAVQPFILAISAMENLVIRGIRFEHAACSMQQQGVMVGTAKWQNLGRVATEDEWDNRNVLIEDCCFDFHNSRGLGLTSGQAVTLRRVAASHNGAQGVSAWTLHNLLVEDLDTHFNNWSGHRGGLAGWGIAGIKFHGTYNAVIRRHTAIGNLTEGQWWDIDNRDVLIEDLVAIGNLNRGLFLEISPGPFRVNRALIVDGGRAAVRVDAAQDVTFENCVLHSNADAGHVFDMTPKLAPRTRKTRVTTQRILENREFGDIHVSSGPLRIAGSVLTSAHPARALFFFNSGHPDDLLQLLRSGRYSGTGNLFHSLNEYPFGSSMGNADVVGFSQWIESARERDARWDDPGFTDASAYDFRLRDDSPLAVRRDQLPASRMSEETRAAWTDFRIFIAAQPAGDGQSLDAPAAGAEGGDPSFAE